MIASCVENVPETIGIIVEMFAELVSAQYAKNVASLRLIVGMIFVNFVETVKSVHLKNWNTTDVEVASGIQTFKDTTKSLLSCQQQFQDWAGNPQ